GLLVERLGWRTLLMFGQFVMALCNMLLTLSIGEVPWTKYFLILALFTMLAFYEIGPGPVSWYITAELFSQSARPVAMGLTSSWNWFHKFIVAMFYQTLLKQ
ncbi:unnamed protein product, partial [Natator depressus]